MEGSHLWMVYIGKSIYKWMIYDDLGLPPFLETTRCERGCAILPWRLITASNQSSLPPKPVESLLQGLATC